MFNSQEKQDELLEKNVFKGYKNGFFVDVGAHDGRSINNTLYFEEANNWTGICIELMPDTFINLQENRGNFFLIIFFCIFFSISNLSFHFFSTSK